jgi:hypothetical protein
MEQQDNIDNVLARRAAAPRAASDLAENIIHKALMSPRQKKVSWAEKVSGILFRPASYAATFAAVIALMVIVQPWGASDQGHIAVHDAAPYDQEFTQVLDVYDDELLL